jgi:hypothetical protein
MKRSPRLPLVIAVLGVVGALACVACDGGPPPQTSAAAAATGPAAGAPRGIAPIAFEAKKSGAKPFPFAFVDGKVGGQPTRFILDTGASVHVLDPSVAAAAHVGSPAKASSISIDGWGTLPDHAIVVRELPAPLRGHGIGGVLSPQLLADSTTEAVVVDFVNKQLRSRPQSAAWSELEDLGVALTRPGARKFCPVDSAGVAGLVLSVDAKVAGQPARLELDTGDSRTVLVEGSNAGAQAVGHPVLGRSVAAATDGDVAVAIHGGVPFSIGAWSTTLEVGVTSAAHHADCGYDGRLGIDVLQQCAIAMTADKLLVACRAAPSSASPAAAPAP